MDTEPTPDTAGSGTPPSHEYAADVELASRLARAAVQLLERMRTELGSQGAAVDAVRKAGDRQSHEFLTGALARERPDDAVLSEEGVDDPVRLDADRVWIVDPLDGTREFGEGRDDWAVHVALWKRKSGARSADGLVAGAVGLAGGEVLRSDPAPERPAVELGATPRVVASRTRAPAVVDAVVEALQGRKLLMGSAGAKIAAVIRGDADAYVHDGGQWEWDSAAPVAVALAAGFTACRLDGAPLVYNLARPYLPDLMVCRPELAEQVLAVTRSFQG
jgi:3'(2'), 5'-bisphosphate nucleotidase